MVDHTGNTGQSEAQRMLDAFASVGVTQFDIAHTNIDQEKRGYRRAQTLRQAKTSLPYLLDSAPRRQNNIILRPHHPSPLFSCSWTTSSRSSLCVSALPPF
jgi:hypothetical protein